VIEVEGDGLCLGEQLSVLIVLDFLNVKQDF